MKKVIVISLGGSLIIPDEVDSDYLRKFKQVLIKNSKKYSFIVVCGGGSIARKYIRSLKGNGINEKFQSLAGISATRMNARFMNYFFNQDASRGIPQKMEEIHGYLRRHNIIFCGGLEYRPEQTSDSTSADVAVHFKADFINLTDVNGLYDKDPKKFKNVELISKISWKDFNKMAESMKYAPGQHFVLDQKASRVIMRKMVKTYILGKDLKQLDNVLNGKEFKGTIIS